MCFCYKKRNIFIKNINFLLSFRGKNIMIKLTKLNGKPFILKSDLIEFIEQTPDTIISTTTGKKVVVVESVEEVVEKVLQYKRKIYLFKDVFINQDR